MRRFIVLLSAIGLAITTIHAKIIPEKLTCEYLPNPMVTDVIKPRLSWINITDEGEGRQFQTAWEIRVAGSRELLLSGKADLWNSGKIISDQSVNVRYKCNPLALMQNRASIN